ncbi:hypothetical protein TSMEX_011379 [Taenia solium]
MTKEHKTSNYAFSLLRALLSCIVQVVLTFIWVGPIALMVFGADTVVASSERIIEHTVLYR